MTEDVTIYEVGPRDGLQNEARIIPASDKIRLVDLATEAGFRCVEVTSFVSPKWVPQMADAGVVMAGITRKPGVTYAALTPNMRGYAAAKAAGADEVAIFAAASETFSAKNINCTIDESFVRFAPVAGAAKADGVRLRGYISCVSDCPYEGAIEPSAVARVAARLLAVGCDQVSLGETLGKARPERVDAMLEAVLQSVPVDRVAGHFHDTSGRALDNVVVSLERGVRVFDASLGGLGGCPYAPGAAGNVATEGLNTMLVARGYRTGIDPDRLTHAAEFARGLKGHGHALADNHA